MSIIIKYEKWSKEIDTNRFFYDLRSSLNSFECGEINKSHIVRWLRRKGFKINFKDYSLGALQ